MEDKSKEDRVLDRLREEVRKRGYATMVVELQVHDSQITSGEIIEIRTKL